MYLLYSVSLKQLLDFLRVNQSKSQTSEAAISIGTWVAKHLGSEVDSIRQELQVSILIKKCCSNRMETDAIHTFFMKYSVAFNGLFVFQAQANFIGYFFGCSLLVSNTCTDHKVVLLGYKGKCRLHVTCRAGFGC